MVVGGAGTLLLCVLMSLTGVKVLLERQFRCMTIMSGHEDNALVPISVGPLHCRNTTPCNFCTVSTHCYRPTDHSVCRGPRGPRRSMQLSKQYQQVICLFHSHFLMSIQQFFRGYMMYHNHEKTIKILSPFSTKKHIRQVLQLKNRLSIKVNMSIQLSSVRLGIKKTCRKIESNVTILIFFCFGEYSYFSQKCLISEFTIILNKLINIFKISQLYFCCGKYLQPT